jgi:hypothetical protein
VKPQKRHTSEISEASSIVSNRNDPRELMFDVESRDRSISLREVEIRRKFGTRRYQAAALPFLKALTYIGLPEDCLVIRTSLRTIVLDTI